MNLVEFLQELSCQGVKFWIEGEKLRSGGFQDVVTPTVIAKLKQHKAEIIQLLRDRPDILNVHPLSYGQKALWFLWEFEPLSAAYNQVFSPRICDYIDLKKLRSAFEELLERHPGLRSTFPKLGAQPIQQVHQDKKVDFQLLDARAMSEAELYSSVIRESQRPFDLEKQPVIRIRLFTISQQEHILLLTIHHIATDGWSLDIILHELPKLYQAQQDGVLASLPTLNYSYSDYVRSQHKMLSGSEGEKLWRYWQDKLKGELPILNLPTDKPRPPIQKYNGASHNFQLSSQLTQQLKQLAMLSDATLYMTLLAAMMVLLYRYTGQEDILVGSPIAARLQSQFRGIVGYFANPVVLRGDLSNNPSFKEFLTQVRQTVLEALTHQEYPFALLVENLQPQRDPSRSPIFQASFALQELQKSQDIQKLFVDEIEKDVDWGGLKLRPFEIPQQEGQFDLDLEMLEGSSSVKGIFKYNTDLFDGSTIERMAAHFQNLLSAIVENPQQVVSELPLLSERERHQLLVEWNDTASNYPTDKCIHQLFEEQVEKTPNAIAVVFGQEQLTYHQLNQRAKQLAHHLQNLGVEPEVLVGICVERSIQMVVGLLGILKAGGAYVPLDPNYPQERLSYMLEDSGVEVLLTQQSLLESLPSHRAQMVCLDSDWPAIEQHSGENLDVGVHSDNLAYVIYTSGSTGQPKGVAIEHCSVCNLAFAQKNLFDLEPTSRVLQFASISFDASVWEIVMAVTNGAMLILGTASELMPGDDLKQILHQSGVTHVTLPPSALAVLPTDELTALGQIIVAGEACPIELVNQWSVGRRFFNAYGPTESTVCATVAQISDGSEKITIGHPIANTKIYILDKHLQPLPIGVPGELYIGGDGLARGYLNRQELTKQKFIQNPFCNSNSERLYKTSDLARYLRDGNIEFIGRIDNQVKIRGFRIELGEIEAVLNTHPQIQQTVVIATEDLPGNKRLVAYILSEEESLSTHQLREFLKQKLPDYMVPSAFVTLDSLPLTPNGKVDRKSLPAPDGVVTSVEEYVAPRTEIEQTLTNLWQELLGKDKVSIHDNFFEIGGDSILSILVVSRAKNSGIQITPQQIFLHQTIAELARVATTGVSINAQQGLVTGVAPLTPIQKRFFAQNKQELHHYNQSVLLEIPNHLDSELIKTAIGKLLEHHDALRLRFPDGASEEQQHNLSLDHNVPFDLVDLSSTPEEEQAITLSKIATDYQRSLNLEDGPIMQVVRFNLGQDRSARLLIIIHHLAVDGVSWRIVLSDLETIYQQLSEQQPIKLSTKTTAFIDWAEKLNNYAQSEILLKELDYWLNQPWSKITPLPKDYGHPNSENTVGSAGYVSRELSVEETTALLGSVNQAYNTQINDILLSGLVLSLGEWTGNSTVLIDLEGHGREELFSDVDLSRTVGWFTSLFPVLLQLASLNQLPSVIKSIKEQLRAIPNRGIGYGLLRYLCQDTTVNQQLQTIPTAEICFNYLGQFDQVQSQTGWKFGSLSTGLNQSEKQYRDHLLEINALVVEGKLQINWTYSSNVHRGATVASLADSYLQALRSIIKHCQLEEAFGYTPSDFPDAQLNQEELDQLLAPIKTKNVSEIYPLSPMQQGMLFHSLYAPDSGVYFEQMTFKIKGNLNVEDLRKSWQLVVDRYSILRTFFVWENRSTPLQVVLKQVDLPWSNLDWRELSATEQQQQLSEMLSTQRESGFQLNLAPLMKCSLIQLSEQTYQFIWSHHHLLMDGWCLPIIFKDVFSFYEAELTGKTYNYPTPRPYGDYIAWLHEQDQETAFEFWRETLLSFSAPTALVVDKPQYHNPQQNSDYQELELRLSDQVSHQLQSVARQNYVTLSTLVQGAWALLLSRYSGEEDVVFGVTVSGRPPSLDGVETMVGLFINTLPLRLQVSPREKLIAWWQQIQQLMSQLQTYCYTPLVEIQGMSEVPGGIPLFESILVFENYPFDRSLLNQESLLELEEIESFEQTNYPLTVVAIPGEQLSIKISYDTLRFDQDTIERMLGHLQTIFSAIVDNPQQEVGELPLLSAEERHQLLVEWNDTASDYPIDQCIHQLFEEQVEKTPNAIAVVFGQEQLTYHQLNQRANQLAHHLLSMGVGPEVLVGICVERSIEMVVGLLGILKAGGAYVPLDPNYPPERLSYMLADSGVEVLLTQSSLLKSLPQNQARVVCLDTDGEAIEQECGDNLNAGVKSDNLAYVIYTSGSTGQPKGVAIEHKSIFNYVCSVITTIHVKPSSNFALVSTISADLGNTVIFPCLLTGGCLHVISQEKASDPNSLSEYFSYYHIEYLKIVPSHLAALQASSNPALVLPSQTLILGGEASSSDWIETIQAQSPNSNIINHYGPTEATVGVLTYFLDKKSLPLRTSILPIGRPIANTQIYILNKHLQPVPIGVPGELYIGGDGLARGYLNRPELTKQKFIPNPLCNSKSERLYKTSDLARYLPDGNIEFLGRIDNQVKIRGFRIELGEIESVLSTHPQIQQTVVIATEDLPGNKRLVAYIVSQSESLSTNQVREFLKEKLPDYMVPSAFVTLDTLPLTPNGKVDHKGLPAPDRVFTRVEEYVAPRTPTEEIIANIFALVLGVKDIGIHDNFFEIGGHSLLATQLISQLRVTFNIEIPLREVFETPTIALIEPKLTQLLTTENQLSLPLIQPRTDSEQLPLSSAQERLWFLNQLEGSSATYNMPAALRISGNLVINALEKTLSEIINRHEVLRTSFSTVNGTPIQVIHPDSTININVVDLQQYQEAERETVLQQQVQHEATTPFDLEVAPLIRCKLWQLDTSEYVLALTMHHIVSDGWSRGILIEELSSLYQAFCASAPSPLAELPIQYADFALWQRQWLSGKILETQLNYWKEALDGAPELLQLPTDRPRPHVQSYRGSSESFSLTTELTQKLQQLSRNSGSTLFMTLQAGFATLLYRYSGQKDILIGSPIANRNRREIEPLIGFFVNTLVLRTGFDDNPSFSQLLKQVRETTLIAYEYQDVPFEQVVEALQPQRSLSHAPLFQVMFVLQNAPMGTLDLPGLSLSQFNQQSTTSKFDLLLSMMETEMGLVGTWEYNTDLFDRSTIARITTHFQNLLSAIVDNPQQEVSELPLLSEGERHQLLVEWNDTAKEYPTDKCIHQLFEEQVEKTPDAIAVVFDQEQLTYHQLNQRANQLAHYLQSLGVGPEVLVGICVERSLQMVVGLLGILKAGGAYLPLDPNYPQERLSYMLADSGVEVLLTQQSLRESLPQNQAQVLCLDSDWGAIEQQTQENLEVEVHSDNLAYVIYTSGSTGQPKGVAMNHSPLVNLLMWQLKNSSAKYSTKTGQFTPISFDVSFQEILSTWCSGGTLVLIPEDVRRDGSALLQLLKQQGVERLFLPFVALEHLAMSALTTPECLPSKLCELITAGEQLQITPTLGNFFEKLSNCRLENQYGPTETHVVSAFKLNGFPSSWSSLPPIGRPIANTQIYILDKHLQPVPIGVPGELYLGGDGLARGYFNRRELTDQKFIPNPFNNSKFKIQNSKLLYKTGDLARYLPDRNIEFLGRIDNQVKIRGFRIELGEIESVLNSHPQIQQTVVIAREDVPGNKRLVAYIVSEEESLTTNQIREFLKQKLPDYMVPSAFVTLETLPLTPNGKVDRKALPAPEGEISRENEYVAPRTPTEEIIANIFANVLGVQDVGIYDNFFEIGGHSLLATQLISQLRVTFNREIPLRQVFETPTIALIEPKLSQLLTTENQLSLPLIQPRTDSEQLPLSSAQERLWFLNQLEGISATYNIPAAFRITGNLIINALEQALSEIISRHEVIRTSFSTINGTPTQVIHPDSTININVVDLQQYPEPERQTILQQQVQQEATTPFNLEVAPLIRCKLWQLDSTEYVLVLTMHHIVSDGWSIGILIQELSSLYQAFCAGVPSPLPELPIQYADFALWQRQWLSGEILERQLNYWKEALLGAPELLQLPTDHPRPHVQSYRGSTESFSLTTELTDKLQQLSRNSGSTLFMTLQAAFATLLYRYSGQSDLLIGTPIANRNRREIEPLIGFFVNTLVLRTRFEHNPSFSQLLRQVRETTLNAYEHQDVPFEQVVSALQPQRSLSHSPLFQVMFVLQNAPMGILDLPGLSLSELNQHSTIAKFDLTLSMMETEMGLVGTWEYNTDLFDGSTIKRMATHFQNLLSAIVENPQQVVSELPLLSERERHQLLVEWNDTASDYPTDKCIHQLVEEQVEKTPDAMAVVFEQEQLTYHQLNQKANQLAHHLLCLGVRPEVLVGICVERSVQMVVGLLGILKAGGAYVPLDPNYPPERLSYMLEDSGVEVLLTQQSLLESLPSHRAQMVCLDSDWEAIEQHSGENLEVGVTSDNLAYVIYTSGSTGQPKGVLVDHKNLVHSTTARLSYYNDTLHSCLLVSSVAFDSSVAGIFWTLCCGGSLIVPRQNSLLEPLSIAKLIAKYQVSHLLCIPSYYAQLLEHNDLQKIVTLSTVIVGGESCPKTLIELTNHLVSNVSIFNEYGPTEATVWSSVYSTQDQESQSWLPIGRPIVNTQIYILDKHLQPLPIGVPGELYIGGDGLARGYLNRPELTSEKFITNPFCNSNSQRLYKTGDLARYLRDGNIEFLGRMDNQVKIRGFRIELGEIEAVLSSHPHIQQTVVIATEDIPGNKRLVAYIVSEEESLTTNQLREFLKQKLPDYMVPSVFVTLDTLPLTPNGKVDRFALPAPDGEITREHKYLPPRTTIELELTQIWSEVLNLTSVGVQDNFFELGGHSLNAVRLMSKIKQQFQINLPLATLFQSPTIEQLASLLGSSVNTQNPILIKTSGNQPPLFCIHPVGGNVLCYAELARHLAQDYPVYGLQSVGLDGQQQPLTSVEEMASHYIQVIQQIQPQGPLHLIGWSLGGVIAYEMAQQLQAKNTPVALLTLIDSYAPTLIRKPLEIDQAMIINQLAQDLGGLYSQELDISLETLRKLEPDEQVLHLFEQGKQQGIFPSDIEIEQMRSLWEVFQANLIAIYNYQAKAYPGSLLLLNASQTSPAVIEDPTHGWGSIVNGDLQTHTITGDHYTIMKAPQVEGITAELNKYLLNN